MNGIINPLSYYYSYKNDFIMTAEHVSTDGSFV